MNNTTLNIILLLPVCDHFSSFYSITTLNWYVVHEQYFNLCFISNVIVVKFKGIFAKNLARGITGASRYDLT